MEKIHKPTVVCPKESIIPLFRLMMSHSSGVPMEVKLEIRKHLIHSKGLGDDFDFLMKLSGRQPEELGPSGKIIKVACALDSLFLRPENEKS